MFLNGLFLRLVSISISLAAFSFLPVGLQAQTNPVPLPKIIKVWTEAFRHNGPVQQIEFSPSGPYVAAFETNGNTVYLWDKNSGKVLHRFEVITTPGTISQIAFSSDGKKIAAFAEGAAAIRAIDGKDDWKRFTCGTITRPSTFAFSGDRIVFCGRFNNEMLVTVYDTEKGRLLQTWSIEGGPINGSNISSDGTLVAVAQKVEGEKSSRITVWNVRARKPVAEVLLENEETVRLRFIGNGRLFTWGYPHGSIIDVSSGKIARELSAFNGGIDISADGNWVTFPRAGKTVIERLDGKRASIEIDGGGSGYQRLSADGNDIAIGNYADPTVFDVWNTRALALRVSRETHVGAILDLAELEEGKLITAGKDGFRKWESKTGKPLGEWRSLQLEAAWLSPSGKTAAMIELSKRDDEFIRLLETNSGEWLGDVRYDLGVKALAISSDDKFVAVSDERRNLRVWELSKTADSKVVHEALCPETNPYFHLAFSQSGKNVFACVPNRMRQKSNILSMAWTENQTSLLPGGVWARHIVVSKIDHLIAAAYAYQNKVSVFSSNGKGEAFVFKTDSNPQCVALSNDAKFVGAGLLNGKIVCWEIATGRIVFEGSCHSGRVTVLRFSEMGYRLFSGGANGSFCIVSWYARK